MAVRHRPILIKGRAPLKRGMHGADIFAVQRALKAAHCRKRKATRHYGIRCVRNVKRFQREHHLKATGRVNQDTLDKLARYFDGYGMYLFAQQRKRTKQATGVSQSVKTAFFLLAHKNETYYSQDANLRMRCITDKIYPPRVPRYFDCSSACTWYRFVAHLSDPNGFGYNGYGFTGTMVEHGVRVSDPKAGDMTFYHNPDHVVIEVGQGRVISNGSSAGPYLLPRTYRPVWQTRRYAS
jgi:peptidoglycan hydrolase-like protein with peptidoglycan-binding domain